MMRYYSAILLVVTAIFHSPEIVSAECVDSNGDCADCEPWCTEMESDCFFVVISELCPVTCGSCKTEECRELGCEHRCLPPANETESAECDCFAGFELDDDKVSCNDINECKMVEEICDTGDNVTSPTCINTAGDYVCSYCDELSDDVFSYYGEKRGCCRLDDLTSCGKSSNNKRPRKDEDRVVGGSDSFALRWPWQAYAFFANATSLCGGSLIHPEWVVTAAHCFEFVGPADSVDVLFGVTDVFDVYNSRDQVRVVDAFFIHENYSVFKPLQNDIALMHLSEPVEINEFVNTICLPGGEDPPVGENCYVTGYGAIDADGNATARILQEADQEIISDASCDIFYSSMLGNFTIYDADTQLCAGVDSAGRSACFGDSGGPLACQRCDSCDWYLTGLVSYGLLCGEPEYYTAYTQVSAYEEWILNHISSQAASFTPQQCTRPTWDTWGQWSDCPVTCGTGIRERTRGCSNGFPGEPDCLGTSRETTFCTTTQCVGEWTDWGNRGECSEICDGGEVKQVRYCDGGFNCEGLSVRYVSCNERPCSGGWSDWGSWSTCTYPCGGGTQNRSRDCLEPTGDCDGLTTDTETRFCNTEECSCSGLSNGLSVEECCLVLSKAGPGFCTISPEISYYMYKNCALACCRVNANPPQFCGALPPPPKCENTWDDEICDAYGTLCGMEAIRQACPDTCNACPPL